MPIDVPNGTSKRNANVCSKRPKVRGVARNLLRGTSQGVWGRKSPSGVQGQSPSGGLGAKPVEARVKC